MLLSLGWLPCLPRPPHPHTSHYPPPPTPYPLSTTSADSLVTRQPLVAVWGEYPCKKTYPPPPHPPAVAVELGLQHLILPFGGHFKFLITPPPPLPRSKWRQKVSSTLPFTPSPRTKMRIWICCLETFWPLARPHFSRWRTTRRAARSIPGGLAGFSDTMSALNWGATFPERTSSTLAPSRWRCCPVSHGHSDPFLQLHGQTALKVRQMMLRHTWFSYVSFAITCGWEQLARMWQIRKFYKE